MTMTSTDDNDDDNNRNNKYGGNWQASEASETLCRSNKLKKQGYLFVYLFIYIMFGYTLLC